MVRSGAATAEPVEGAGSSSASLPPEVDPAFKAAIDEGRLTVEHALARGQREAFASQLVRRHQIPLDLAYGVTDNRLSLHEALGRSAAARAARARFLLHQRGVRLPHLLLALFIPAAAAVALCFFLWSHSSEPRGPVVPIRRPQSRGRSNLALAQRLPAILSASRAPAPVIGARLSATAIRRDGLGRTVEIVGPDPAAVLEAFCRLNQAAAVFEPVEITETVPKLGNARHGAFRDPLRPGTLLAIWIREDRKTRRWIAGDGKSPIPVGEAPALAQGAFRKAVALDRPAQTEVVMASSSDTLSD